MGSLFFLARARYSEMPFLISATLAKRMGPPFNSSQKYSQILGRGPERVMLGAEVTFHFFVPEPQSEMGWRPWGDPTGCREASGRPTGCGSGAALPTSSSAPFPHSREG